MQTRWMHPEVTTDDVEELDLQRDDPTYFLHERYLGGRPESPLLMPYYRLKPLIPRSVQLALRRTYARRQAARPFPSWPIEPSLIEMRDERIKSHLRTEHADRLPLVGFWPGQQRFACVLTHDVEGPAGVENIERVIEVEQRHGFVSSWNFVAEWYPIPPGTFERLRAAGCEIGLHGIKHDGRLFESRAQFEVNLPKIHEYLERWEAVGFRSPATHRRAEWMHELGCLYDSSFPDTDPFEPRAGGCCSIFPFMFGDVVELPITLVQDHTLMEILRHDRIDLWVQKSEWIIRNHGLVNLITHPDYLIDPGRLQMYDELLGFLARQDGCWRALPREVADWWRLREAMDCELSTEGVKVVGDETGRATPMWATDRDGEIEFEL
jgi:peptidoglycan/xylan/chitin deacetylase (PgdA/CDA1 family)